MDHLHIVTQLTAEVAIRLGIPRAGKEPYPLEGVLPRITGEQRKWLAAHVSRAGQTGEVYALNYLGTSHPLRLDALPGDEVVAGAIIKIWEVLQAHEKKAAAEVEAQVLAALELALDAWVGRGPAWYHGVDGKDHHEPVILNTPRGNTVDMAARQDARFVARREEAMPHVEALHEQWEKGRELAAEKRKAVEAAELAENARKTAIEVRAENELRRWAEGCESLPTNLRRAATDGYNIRPAAKKWACDRMRACILEVVGPLGGSVLDNSTETFDLPDRPPSTEAYAISDALASALGKIAASGILPGIDLELDGPTRVKVELPDGGFRYACAVGLMGFQPWLGGFGFLVCTENIEGKDTDE